MENIESILKGVGIDIPEDRKADFDKAFKDNYKTISEFNKMSEKNATLTATNKEYEEKIKGLESDSQNVIDLQNKVKEYEEAERQRKQAEEAERANAELKARFSPLKGENEFINEYTENGVFEMFKSALTDKANTGKSDTDIFNSLVADKDVFKNKNKQIIEPLRKTTGDRVGETLKSLYAGNPFFNG